MQIQQKEDNSSHSWDLNSMSCSTIHTQAELPSMCSRPSFPDGAALAFSPPPQIITLVLGIAILVISFVATYFINAKADVLFATPGDTGAVAY